MFKCKTCEALREENQYLKGLVDRLLIKQGVTPKVEEELELPSTEKLPDQYGE